MWRSRLPLGLLVLVASCQPTGDGDDPEPVVNGPISDFPRAGGGIVVNPASPVTPTPSTTPGGTGGAVNAGSTPGGAGGAGGASPGTGGTTTAPPPTVVDAGVPMDAGRPAGSNPDAGLAQQPDAASDAGAGDGAAPMPIGDGGCPRLLAPDSGICSAYGCSLSLDQLRASAGMAGACTAPAALAAACDGSASSAALRCTEASVFSADLREGASSCVKRDPQLSALGATCLDCFVDEALCTLSRCFTVCALASENDDCRTCRHKQCAGALSQCTGLPAP